MRDGLGLRRGLRRGLRASVAAGSAALVLTGCFSGPGAQSGPPRLLVVGDSLAYQVGSGLERMAGGHLTIVNGGVGGCGIGPGEIEAFGDGEWFASACPNWRNDWQALVDTVDPDVVVLGTGFWEAFDRRVDGKVLAFGSREADAALVAAYERALQILGSTGATVTWLAAACFAPAPWYGRTFDYADWKIDHINDLYEHFTASHAQTTLLNSRTPICPGDRYAQVVDGWVVRPDDGIHYTVDGENLVGNWLLPHLVALAG